MRLVIIESPFRGVDYKETEQNITYARACVRDSLLRGEAPFASHLLYTQQGILDDKIAMERLHGIHAGFEWRKVAEATIFYLDRSWSSGMRDGFRAAQERVDRIVRLGEYGHTIDYRYLGQPWSLFKPGSFKTPHPEQ